MAKDNNSNSNGFFIKEFRNIFGQQWSPLIGGILLGITNVLMFAYAKPWGIADGVWNWGDHILKIAGLTNKEVAPFLIFTTSVTNLGLISGAMISSLMAKEFGIKIGHWRDLLRGFIGGILMGIGSVMAMGCTIGGFFTSFGALSIAGPTMMIGLLIGAYLGLKILIFEVSRSPLQEGLRKNNSGKKRAWLYSYQPIIGFIILIGLVTLSFIDEFEFTYSGISGNRGVLLLFGLFLGIVNQRSRFCFVKAFREPFMTGDGKMTKAAAVALIVVVIGFAIIKGTDLNDMRSMDEFVNATFWIGSLIGGLIFGIGMILAGGCAAGALWRSGEGQVKLWLAILGFALSGSLFRTFLIKNELMDKLGKSHFLPDIAGWQFSLLILLGLALLWYIFAAWNEEKGKFIIL